MILQWVFISTQICALEEKVRFLYIPFNIHYICILYAFYMCLFELHLQIVAYFLLTAWEDQKKWKCCAGLWKVFRLAHFCKNFTECPFQKTLHFVHPRFPSPKGIFLPAKYKDFFLFFYWGGFFSSTRPQGFLRLLLLLVLLLTLEPFHSTLQQEWQISQKLIDFLRWLSWCVRHPLSQIRLWRFVSSLLCIDKITFARILQIYTYVDLSPFHL